MTTAAAPRRRKTEIAFETLSIQGGLISPESLLRIAQVQAGHQFEADYRVPKGLRLREEIGRYWRVAQAYWNEYATAGAAGADPTDRAHRFVVGLLRDCFGFASLAPTSPIFLSGRSFPIGYQAVGGRVPVVIAPAEGGLESSSPAFGDSGRRRSASNLLQEYLNAAENAQWGLVSDGLTLRILRDNVSLTRPAWIEADIARLFSEERFADFTALWLLIHETRFGAADRSLNDSPLETWRGASRDEGTRAREHLRTGVEDALVALGHGFLSHASNEALREALSSGNLTTRAYFQELLRVVYRIIFLITAEERDLLHPRLAEENARSLYADGYALRRLRQLSARGSAHDRFVDLWESLKIVFRGAARGEPALAIPALGGIFSPDRCPTVDGATLENRHLLTAIFRLTWLREEGGLSRVNWRDMGPEELGSVYESLLELVPRIEDGRSFSFASSAEATGNARKTTGSYYTPEDLVQVLLNSALDPVIRDRIAENPRDPAQALLSLSIVDPACGSGHFLLAAARRVAMNIVRLETQGAPSTAQYQAVLRQVVGRCLFGVDMNPMAVELCQVSLWMEAVEPGLPLSFLDSHIRIGNSLLGITPDLMKTGVPDSAWEPIAGDDKKVATALKKRNKAESVGQRSMGSMFSSAPEKETSTVATAVAQLDATPDADPSAIASKASQWEALLESAAFRHQVTVADTWCAAFLWPKTPGELAGAAPTNDLWQQIRDGETPSPELTRKTTEELAGQYRLFHWHLAFPQVFAKGGFDVVLGNPPWERVKLQEQEFFASKDEEIANAPNSAARKKLIAALPFENPQLWEEWRSASREAEGQAHFLRNSGRYPLCGKGDVNTYAIFAEHNRTILGPKGRAGFIVPTGIATDDTTKEYFGALVRDRELASFVSFENEEFVFPAVHHAFRFALMTVDRSGRSAAADLIFFARQVSALAEPDRHFTLSPSDFEILNPNTLTCPTFRSRRDADLNLSLYRRAGILWRDGDPDGNPWGLQFLRMLDMANDSGSFRTRAELEAAGWKRDGNHFILGKKRMLPLIEAKMIHQFDHRFGTYEGQTEAQANQGKLPEFDDEAHQNPARLTLPKYWVEESEVFARLEGRAQNGWLLGWRDICRSTDQRTVIASLMPRAAVGHTTPLLFSNRDARVVAALYANMCSFSLDYAARQKVGGTHLTYGLLKQLPVLGPSIYGDPTPWTPDTQLRDWLLPRVLELTYTATDLESFAHDCGHDGPPFRWDPDRRLRIRAELDAAFFHLYGLSHEDAEHILDSFPVVRKNDEKHHGEYRTKRLILETYAAMSSAVRSRQPYRSALTAAGGK